MADNQQQIDHYDFINAPQFVDFDDLAAHDDPQADKFFETHREEDDFMIPLDINNISPTVQLLYNTGVENGADESDDNEHYSNEANKAAMAAGLEDVKIEYYASPQSHPVKSQSQPSSANKKTSLNSTTSMYGTPLGPLGGSGYSSAADSFRTPTGGEDKENVTPAAGSIKKLLKNEPFQIKAGGKPEVIEDNNSQRVILSERSVGAGGNLSTPTHTPGQSETESLYAKLDKLMVISSDEEDATEDASFFTSTQGQQNASLEEPKEVEATDLSTNSYSTFNENKLSFLGLSTENNQPGNSDNDSSSEQGDITLICRSSGEHKEIPISPIPHANQSSDSEEEVDNNESAPMELGTPVRNILKKLDAELHLELEPQESESEPRYSILVAPSVGRQVHWNHEEESVQQHIQLSHVAATGRELNVSYKVDEAPVHLNEHTLTYDPNDSDDSEDEFYGIFAAAVSSSLVPARRASSVGDLVSLMEPKARDFTTYGYNPRVGITIPKTPESESVDVQQEQRPGPSTLESFSSNMNSCYFEIEPPKPSKGMRRVSSLSDLLKVQEMKTKPVASRKPVQKRLPTIPRTPEALKRSQKGGQRSNIPSASSSKNESIIGRKNEAGPSVADRLAATRQPMKGNHYVSMAEAMINYQKSTPDRFRSLPRGRTVPEKRSASSDSRKRFTPSPAHSPESTSRGNMSYCRPTTAGNNGPVLPKRVELKPTIPKPFNFGSTHKHKAAVLKEDTVDFKFKARPAPSKNLHEPAGPRVRPPLKVTLPMSPRFASDERLRERQLKRAHPKSPESKLSKGKSQQAQKNTSRIPINASCNRSHVEEHKTTVTQPFSSSFEARQKEILRKKEDKIKQELERANKIPEFHANPVPKFSGKLPKKKLAEATHVEPFRLKSDERGAAYQEAFKQKLEEEEQHLKEQKLFHAQSADVIHKAPFEPERPTRFIEPQEFNLATVKRAAEREQYDEQLRERERDDEERRREEQEKLEELQKLEDIERRRQLVHKAQPFKAPKPFQLKASAKPLTLPQSPAFSALPSERRIGKPQNNNLTFTQ